MNLQNDDPSVAVDLKYTDREDLSTDEILDEGYTMNDDFNWEGTLPGIWKKVVLDKINQSNFIKNTQTSSENLPFLIVSLIHTNREIQELIPAEEKSWEPFLQEIIQAAFEKAGKERPLLIRFLAIIDNKAVSKELMLSFADRKLQITSRDDHGAAVKKSLSWQSGQKLMKNIYILDYADGKGTMELPQSDGYFIDVGDGLWYALQACRKPHQQERPRYRTDRYPQQLLSPGREKSARAEGWIFYTG